MDIIYVACSWGHLLEKSGFDSATVSCHRGVYIVAFFVLCCEERYRPSVLINRNMLFANEMLRYLFLKRRILLIFGAIFASNRNAVFWVAFRSVWVFIIYWDWSNSPSQEREKHVLHCHGCPCRNVFWILKDARTGNHIFGFVKRHL